MPHFFIFFSTACARRSHECQGPWGLPTSMRWRGAGHAHHPSAAQRLLSVAGGRRPAAPAQRSRRVLLLLQHAASRVQGAASSGPVAVSLLCHYCSSLLALPPLAGGPAFAARWRVACSTEHGLAGAGRRFLRARRSVRCWPPRGQARVPVAVAARARCDPAVFASVPAPRTRRVDGCVACSSVVHRVVRAGYGRAATADAPRPWASCVWTSAHSTASRRL